jgi:hypothetical protein
VDDLYSIGNVTLPSFLSLPERSKRHRLPI